MRQAFNVAMPFVSGMVGLSGVLWGITQPDTTVGTVWLVVALVATTACFALAIDAAATLVLDRLADVVDVVLELTGEDRDDA